MDTIRHETEGAHALSVGERDRRYGLIRGAMRDRGIDALIVAGTNLLYLSGGLPGEMLGLLPAAPGEEFEALINWRHLVDIPHEVMLGSQEWVKRVRPGRNAAPLADRLRELRLESGTIGYAGPFSHDAYSALMKAVPTLKLVDASEILNDVRTIKSPAEIALIDRANHVFNAAIQRIQEKARPGMLGREVVQLGLNAMWDAGGDIGSHFSFNFGPRPAQNPVLAELCLNRKIEVGDIGTLTAHSHYHHYAGHSDQEIAFGDPKPAYVKQFDGVKKVRQAVLKRVRAGVTQRDLFDAYDATCAEVGYGTSEHAQMHQYGLDVPEFPGPGFRIPDAKGGKGLAGGGNFTLVTGMIYSISPTLLDHETEDLLLGGTSLAVTDDGYQELGAREVDLLVAG
ncbi:MAG TPA: M24 family metallopeptidase [Stellaceae bacterium]|nr:M24 family metallopeptidase [Stellaceae bacterium]